MKIPTEQNGDRRYYNHHTTDPFQGGTMVAKCKQALAKGMSTLRDRTQRQRRAHSVGNQ
ncbi:MAG: hypothetical protein RBJ76_07335 [Stenomitos frigidus ULC029]